MESDLANVILSTLASRGSRGISFIEVAQEAFRCGLPKLAELLLDHEPLAASQVPLLLSMGADERVYHSLLFKYHPQALDKAILSGNMDLIYLALFHLKKKVKGHPPPHPIARRRRVFPFGRIAWGCRERAGRVFKGI